MKVQLYTHKACLEHFTGPNHPEKIDRLKEVLAALSEPPFNQLAHKEAPRATFDQLSKVHSLEHIERVFSSIPNSGIVPLDPDTTISSGSGEAALRAAGAVCGGVDAILLDNAKRVFCAVRPPGHHAEPSKAMGFCIFNNIAIGVAYAQTRYLLKKIAVIDFDVHHGNGTQKTFWYDPAVLVAGSQQMPLYPGTGAADEKGQGNIVNMPLNPYSGSEEFRNAWASIGLPCLETFEPEIIFISAGFDGHHDDPLAQLNLTTEDFSWLTKKITRIADKFSSGRIISALEGGYDLPALAKSCTAHVRALM